MLSQGRARQATWPGKKIAVAPHLPHQPDLGHHRLGQHQPGEKREIVAEPQPGKADGVGHAPH